MGTFVSLCLNTQEQFVFNIQNLAVNKYLVGPYLYIHIIYLFV